MEVIMKTSVIGFPRIGTLRELKFASEKYFRKEIEVKKLLHTAELLRKEHWATQKTLESIIFQVMIFLFMTWF